MNVGARRRDGGEPHLATDWTLARRFRTGNRRLRGAALASTGCRSWNVSVTAGRRRALTEVLVKVY